MKVVVFDDYSFAIRKGWRWIGGYRYLIKNTFSPYEKAWLWVGRNDPWIRHAYHETFDSAFAVSKEYYNYFNPTSHKITDYGRPYKYRVP